VKRPTAGVLGDMNPYLFIVGCPRSGTTLLRRLVDTHPLVAVIDEVRWIASFFERREGLTPEGLVTPELVDRLLAYDRFANLEISREQLRRSIDTADPVSYPTFVTGIFDLYGLAQGKSLVGDKTPRYVRRIATLHALWPHARFVHIIRDGRDVCMSILNWKKAERALGRFSTWEEDPITTAAVWWEWHVRLGREDGGSLAPQLYHEVRYETLVSEPAKECETLCDFLDLPYDDAMLKFHEGRAKMKPGRDAKRAWLPITSGLRVWSEQMPAEDLERFEAAAGDLLEELGYPRACPPPPEEKLARAARIRESFARDASALGKRLPKGWQA
jgi:Sulfotransferase family